ncbi:MAG: hypothetical protein AB8H80_12780 [Planctomycetota bacterium]
MLRQSNDRPRWWAALGFLLVAFAFGVVLGPSAQRYLAALGSPNNTDSEPAMPKLAANNGANEPSQLAQLQVEIAPADYQKLKAHRDRSLQNGIIEQSVDAVVAVAVRRGEQTGRGTARLKGDWVDHVDSDQWSLRFDLDKPIDGMRRFSIQHPKTRGFVMEWLVMKTARKLGVLAPRADFAQVSINGAEPVAYYLEEHASKQLLESQGRRDGPIVRFDEAAMWGTWMQYGWHRTGTMPAEVTPAATFFRTELKAYAESHLRGSRAMEQRLLRALGQARELQRRIVAADAEQESGPENRPLALQAELVGVEARLVEDLFDVDRLGRWLALQAFFNGLHGLAWHQLRFYHDPVLDRLEPLVFDTGAILPMAEQELLFASPEARWFTRSPRVLAAAYRHLGRMTEPAWLDQLVADLREEPALREADRLNLGFDANLVLNLVLRQQADKVRQLVRPRYVAGFDARLLGVRDTSGKEMRVVEVDAWARTEVATQLTGFRFGNGRELAASAFVVAGRVDRAGDRPSDAEATAARIVRQPDGSILLPTDGSRVRLRFPVDERLLTLGEIAAIKRAIRATVAPTASGSLDLSARFRPVAELEDRLQPLVLRRDRSRDGGAGGRPVPLPLAEVLARHAFLDYDLARDQLLAKPGVHTVVGDLMLPEDRALHLSAGCELRFAPEAVLVAGALLAPGSAQEPIRVLAADAARGFAGVLVLGTAGASRLTHTEFRGAHGIARGAWQVSGGVTFRSAAVDLQDCTVAGATGEDALNLIGLRFRMQRCTIDGGPHDLFDGDFVVGSVLDCRFLNSGEDAIDVSGSDVDVVDCRFESIGDKALSVGEGSQLRGKDLFIDRASIAVASKDRSEVAVDGLAVGAVENYLAAAYIKKPEFGAAKLRLQRVSGAAAKRPSLAQTGCEVVLGERTLATEDVDVDALYRSGVLGK